MLIRYRPASQNKKKIKEASIKTTALSLAGIIALGGVVAWSGAEDGGAAHGTLFSFIAILPILLFTSFIFPATAHFTRANFSIKKWIALNLTAVLLISIPTSVALCLWAGSVFTRAFMVSFTLLSMGLIFPSGIWLWIAKSKNKNRKPNKRLHSIGTSPPQSDA